MADENIPSLRENFYECVYYIHYIKPFEILLQPLQDTTVVAIIDKFEDLWCKNYKTLIVNHEKISEKLVHKMKSIPRRE